jgi:hypothetical protein
MVKRKLIINSLLKTNNKSYKRELWIRGQKKLSIFKYLKAKEKFCEECSTATGRAKFFF